MKTTTQGKFLRSTAFLLIIIMLMTPASVTADTQVNEVNITVGFDANGGQLKGPATLEITGTGAAIYPDLLQYGIPTRTGYTFKGWYKEKSGGTAVRAGDSAGTESHTLFAQWTANTYKVIFKGKGGKVSKPSKTVTFGNKYGTLAKVTRKNYEFKGWYTKAGRKVSSDTKYQTAGNTTLYAKWGKKNKFTLRFDANGGSVSKGTKTVTYNKKYGTLPTPKRKGYNFKGWYTKKSGGSKVTSKSTYKLTKGRTLYARWQAKKITVKFNANRGKVNKKSKTVTYDRKYGTLPKPKRSGYKFKGWYTKKSGGTKLTKSSYVKYSKSKTLYAKWAKISTLTFSYRGGKGSKKSKKIVYSEKYGSLPKAKRAGYTFKGWYTKKSGGTLITSSSKVTAKKNIKLYAQWGFELSIKKMYAPEGSACRPGYALDNFGGVTIHNTGNSSATADAENHALYLQGTGKSKQASWHYCVDETNITQSIPENETAWHAGDGKNGYGNSRNIAIEICMNEGGNLLTATDRAALLTAYILGKNGHTVAMSKVNLFQHNHHSGKNCPEMIRKGLPYNWDTFVSKVNLFL